MGDVTVCLCVQRDDPEGGRLMPQRREGRIAGAMSLSGHGGWDSRHKWSKGHGLFSHSKWGGHGGRQVVM